MNSQKNHITQLWREIAEASRLLRDGVPVAIPTETVYGLAAVIDQPSAIEQVFRLKERPFFDPLIVHVEDLSEVSRVAREISGTAQKLAEHFWPGPLTLVLPRREDLNPMICAGLDTVAVRAPAHPVAKRLLRNVGVPLAAPSANKFGKTSASTAAHVRSNFSHDSVFVVDAGPSQVGIESTVVRIGSGENEIEILRPGIIGEAEIKRCLPEAIVLRRSSTASPGSTPEHYRPSVPLIIVREARWPISESDRANLREKLKITGSNFAELTLRKEPALAARELYSELHRIGGSGADGILCRREKFMSGDAWDAVWDRLGRAASLELGG